MLGELGSNLRMYGGERHAGIGQIALLLPIAPREAGSWATHIV
jgi:hypothetical protein